MLACPHPHSTRHRVPLNQQPVVYAACSRKCFKGRLTILLLGIKSSPCIPKRHESPLSSGDLATPDESRGASCQLWKTRSCPCCTFIWAGADQSGGPAFVSKYIRILIKGLYQEPLSRRPGRDLRARCATQGLLVPARELATRLWASWASIPCHNSKGSTLKL